MQMHEDGYLQTCCCTPYVHGTKRNEEESSVDAGFAGFRSWRVETRERGQRERERAFGDDFLEGSETLRMGQYSVVASGCTFELELKLKLQPNLHYCTVAVAVLSLSVTAARK